LHRTRKVRRSDFTKRKRARRKPLRCEDTPLYAFFGGENMHRALYTLFHHRASRFVRVVDVAVEMVVVRATTARTDKFRETVFTFFARE